MASTPSPRRQLDGVAVWSLTARFSQHGRVRLPTHWLVRAQVRALFRIARERQPSVIFLDEVDSLLSARGDGDQESSRRMKTEFLVQLDGAGTSREDRILFMAATNRPWDLDDALLRRVTKQPRELFSRDGRA